MNLLQWPAMMITIAAAWLTGSTQAHRRQIGFWLMLFSNDLWIVWGLRVEAWALIVLQVGLAWMNVRGARKAAG